MRQPEPQPVSTREKNEPSVWLPPCTNPWPTQVTW